MGRASGVEAPRAREGAAAGELYARYSERIYRYCLSRLRSREEAEDATQTTFLNAFRGLQRGVTPELEQAWLYKIAENVCLTRVRSNVRRLRVESPTDLDPLHEFVAAPQRERDELHGIADALATLPEQQRRAILLREWQGLSYREIANELGITQSAVETLLFRARRSLARALEGRTERRGRLRKGANLGSVLAWLKSIAVGGSTAAKVAAVIAAGSAVAVAGSSRTGHHARLKTNHDAVPAVIAPTPVARVHLQRPSGAPALRVPRDAPHSSKAVVARPSTGGKVTPRHWSQRVPREAGESPTPSSSAANEIPASTPASEPEKTHAEKPAPPVAEHTPPAKGDTETEKPEPVKSETPPPAHQKPAKPTLPPPAAPNASDNPSAQAPGRLRDKTKQG